MCRKVKAPELELILYVRTRWSSMYNCLDRAIALQTVRTYRPWKDSILIHSQAVTRFAQLADDSEEVPPLRNKKYSWWRLSKVEWDGLKLMHEVLKVSHHIRIPHADTESLTIDDRSRRQHSNLSQILRTLLPGERSRCSNSCNRHGLTQPVRRSLLSSRTRFTAVWTT